MCLLPHQALDVFDDLGESPDWRDVPFCLEWESYSISFSEEDRVEWRTTKNRRSPSLRKNSVYGGIVLTPEQTQELYLFLEQNQGETSESIRKRVQVARDIQNKRFSDVPDIICNADMRIGEVRKFCQLQPEGQSLMRAATSCCA